jgi:hypothetical protein
MNGTMVKTDKEIKVGTIRVWGSRVKREKPGRGEPGFLEEMMEKCRGRETVGCSGFKDYHSGRRIK